MIDESLYKRISDAGVLAVATVPDAKRAVKLAQTLLDSGITGMELTLRTPQAVSAIEAIHRDVPEMLICAGTVLTPDQLKTVQAAGATLAVAPGFNPDTVRAARTVGLPFAPGVMTPSDIEGAIALGCTVLKFYHAKLAGGLSGLRAMAGPYAHLGLRFIPLGGVELKSLGDWLSNDIIAAVGGSWIAPPDDIENERWDEIAKRASEAARVREESKGNG